MVQGLQGNSAKVVNVSSWKACLVGVLGLVLCLSGNESAQATAGSVPLGITADPYTVQTIVDTTTESGPSIADVKIEARIETVQIDKDENGNPVTAKMMTFNGMVPGPEFRLKVGDTVIVHFTNNLPNVSGNVTGIHWHGVELNNASDGTPLTQVQVLPGGTFEYKFKVTRPGIFWYHPHHHSATNQVFRGLYGSFIVVDPYEAQLQARHAIPSATQTKTLVLSDITVCKAPNDAKTYDDSLPHVSGSFQQSLHKAPTPLALCETNPIDENGKTRAPYNPGDVPNILKSGTSGTVGEGQTILTNGVNVGGRVGSPTSPGVLASNAKTLDVQAGQGLRLQIINAAATRYARLRLTDKAGVQIPLVRIGGQGGLLDRAVVEGGVINGFDFKYEAGEILVPPGSREDVVAAIPRKASDILTLWTEDFERTGATYSWIPTVPVMHLKVAGSVAPSYTIVANHTPLRQGMGVGARVEVLGGATGHLINPNADSDSIQPPEGTYGLASEDIKLTNTGSSLGVDGFFGHHDGWPPYESSARHAYLGDTLELTVTNVTGAHHPFHLHGFSVQPISLTDTLDDSAFQGLATPNVSPGIGPSYNFPYHEFRDEIDIPAGYTLKFRVRLDDRQNLYDSTTPGGVGRWVFHCHILFHANFGMMSELHVHEPKQ